MHYVRLAGAVLLVLLCVPGLAAGAPPQAMNKTITISFTASGMAKSPEGQVKGYSTQVTRIIYVSSAGRLFMRHRASQGKNSRGGDFARARAEEASASRAAGWWASFPTAPARGRSP